MEWRLGPNRTAHDQVSLRVQGQRPLENFLAHFVTYWESYAQNRKTIIFGD